MVWVFGFGRGRGDIDWLLGVAIGVCACLRPVIRDTHGGNHGACALANDAGGAAEFFVFFNEKFEDIFRVRRGVGVGGHAEVEPAVV